MTESVDEDGDIDIAQEYHRSLLCMKYFHAWKRQWSQRHWKRFYVHDNVHDHVQ